MDLLATLHSSLSPLFLGQLKNLHKTVATRYAKDLTSGLKEPGYDFAEVVKKGTNKARSTFLEAAKGECNSCLSYMLIRHQRSESMRRTGSTSMKWSC
jgi:hypothetical protein